MHDVLVARVFTDTIWPGIKAEIVKSVRTAAVDISLRESHDKKDNE